MAANPNALIGNNAYASDLLRPLRGWRQINLYESNSDSNYNALELNLRRRFGRGLTFGMAYTVSKALTTSSSATTYVASTARLAPVDYGPAGFDRRQLLTCNYLYSLQKFGMKGCAKSVVGGWPISGVTFLSTGSQFTPGFSISRAEGRPTELEA